MSIYCDIPFDKHGESILLTIDPFDQNVELVMSDCDLDLCNHEDCSFAMRHLSWIEVKQLHQGLNKLIQEYKK